MLNWLTHSFDNRDGYGNMCQYLVRHLIQAGVQVTPLHYEMLGWAGWLQQAAGIDWSRLTITMTPGFHIESIPGRQWALSMYEATRIPDNWVTAFNAHCERLIVPSDWCKEVFEDCGVKVPIHVVFGGTEPSDFPVIQPQHHRPYTFMALGDRGARKGWDFVYQAFYEAFGRDTKDVRLIVKARKYNLNDLDISSIRDPRISIWRGDTRTLFDAFIHADCFVFPSRGEGWGMPPREAAMMGLPVIATRYSGLVHGLDEWAIPLENYRLTDTTIPGGGQWAFPDYKEVAAQMRWCYDNQDAARAKGLQAAAWLRENQTYAHSVKQLTELINEH